MRIEQLFSLQRDVVIGVCGDVISFVNAAGKTRYPDLEPGLPAGTVLPEDVLTADAVPFTCSATVREAPCTVICTGAEDLRVYTVIPEERAGDQGELLDNISATMRRTLTVMNMATELLTPAIEQLEEPKQSANLTILNKTYYQLRRLCDNLDQFFRLKSGADKLQPVTTDIVKFCGDLIQSVTHFFVKRKISLTFQAEMDHLPMSVDPRKMEKLLLNLISNSAKYMEDGGSLSLVLSRRGDRLTISLRDTGAGIPADSLPYVFEQYRRERASTDIQAGTGLGMAIVQEIAQLHGGSLLLLSQQGEGTTVSVVLPIRQTEGDGQLEEPAAVYGPGENGMHTILTELSDVLGYEDFTSLYMD